MKKLPKYFAIKRDNNNPLWEKFINWCNNKYKINWMGKSFCPSYYGINNNEPWCSNHLHSFDEDFIFITLEEWNECVNKKNFALPENWFIKGCKEVWKWGGYKASNPIYVDNNKAHASQSYYLSKGYTEITFEQFKKYVLMESNKEIIGYKLKDDFKKYWQAVLAILGVSEFYANQTITSDAGIRKLKNAQVLKEWFEPVYKSKYSLPKINGYDGELINKHSVKYGCAELDIDILRSINSFDDDNVGNRSIKSIKLDSGVEITIDQIKQILDYVDNK